MLLAVDRVWVEPATSRLQVRYSTTTPLHQQYSLFCAESAIKHQTNKHPFMMSTGGWVCPIVDVCGQGEGLPCKKDVCNGNFKTLLAAALSMKEYVKVVRSKQWVFEIQTWGHVCYEKQTSVYKVELAVLMTWHCTCLVHFVMIYIEYHIERWW